MIVAAAPEPVPAHRRSAPAAPDAAPSTPLPLGQPQGGDRVLRLPLRLFRYHQRSVEDGASEGPEWIDGPGLPQDHVLHRTTSF